MNIRFGNAQPPAVQFGNNQPETVQFGWYPGKPKPQKPKEKPPAKVAFSANETQFGNQSQKVWNA